MPTRPDAVCLQETKVSADTFPHDELAAAGYHAAEHSAGQWAGVAILAPANRRAARGRLDGPPGQPAARGGALGRGDGRRGACRQRLRDQRPRARRPDVRGQARVPRRHGRSVRRRSPDSRSPSPVTSTSPRPTSTCTTPRRSRAAPTSANPSASACARSSTPGSRTPSALSNRTWCSTRGGTIAAATSTAVSGLRIDLALVSPDLASRLVAAGFDRDFRKGKKPSDHAPVLFEFAE